MLAAITLAVTTLLTTAVVMDTVAAAPRTCLEPPAARQAIFEYIEGWYNTRRRHSSLGYRSPAVYDAGTTGRTMHGLKVA